MNGPRTVGVVIGALIILFLLVFAPRVKGEEREVPLHEFAKAKEDFREEVAKRERCKPVVSAASIGPATKGTIRLIADCPEEKKKQEKGGRDGR